MMSEPAKILLVQACHRLLRPLARTLLRFGVTYNDFAEVSKTVYAEVARESFTPDGRRPTDARVATVTGLTRKEAKRVREHGDHSYSQRDWGGANRATRVLAGWYRDPDFTDINGAPRSLGTEDEEYGFAALVRRYSGDIPGNAILEELERVMAIERDESNRLRVRSRAFVPDVGDPESIRMIGTAAHDLIHTLEYNLTRADDTSPRFQRSVFNTHLDPRVLPIFHRLVNEHGQQMLETFDDWLEQHEIAASDSRQGVRTGVGIYFFQDDLPREVDRS